MIERDFEFVDAVLAGEKSTLRVATMLTGQIGSDSLVTGVAMIDVQVSSSLVTELSARFVVLPVRMDPKHLARSAILGLGVANVPWGNGEGLGLSVYSFRFTECLALPISPCDISR